MTTTTPPTAAVPPSTHCARAGVPTVPIPEALAALAASKLPVAEASVVLEHLAGVQLPPTTLDREAKRQCRFKRPGQFWSPVGDEALLCLETFWRNERWALLFPHTAFDPSRN